MQRRGALVSENVCTFPSVWLACCSVRGSSVSAACRFASCEEIAEKFVFEELISEVELRR